MPIKADWIEFKVENIRALPGDLVGVYECGCKRGDKVLYIGKGVIRERLLDHIEKKKFLEVVTHFRKRRSENPEHAERRLWDSHCRAHGGPPTLNTDPPTKRNRPRDVVTPIDKVKPLI